MLPISVLVPTRNSMSLLPKHLDGMRSWLDLVEEVVAVDSHSTDGTLESLQRDLQHPNVRVLTHPPGLYQSWNFGIAQCRAKYIYVSTVGDGITREGILELHATAERFAADVVISPPRFMDMEGQVLEKVWPVTTLLENIRVNEPVALEGLGAQLYAVTFVQRGMLGSSASNLYRATELQRFPFRTDFGTAGDVAWGLEHAGQIRLAVVPHKLSTFIFHPKSYSKSDYAVSGFAEKCIDLATEIVAMRPWKNGRAGNFDRGASDDEPREASLHELLLTWRRFVAAKRVLDARRAKGSLFYFMPASRRARAERRATKRLLPAVQERALELVARSLIRCG
jgi:glycosyltransferase involved in cell wall biosynthesis